MSATAPRLGRAARPGRTARPTRTARVVAPDGRVADVTIDDGESPLAWLATRRDKDGVPLLSPAAFAAGERFRTDYTVAGLMARTTMNWDALGGPAERRAGGGAGGGLLVTEAAMAARDRVNRALSAVGPELGSVLVDVCCHLKGLGDVERDQGWPLRSGKVVLRMALAALARHYGLAEAARGGEAARPRHWGAADYRPKA
ncbi:DUF6456 domain-containing protein [Chthonobacter rhizosphaerae]|uniref:DUF6456 domain-containing protein n=1 Tax=Chthonobacter rhizosphaerae TaxID=2735553 RepID=UPI001AEE675B|nr:DUF6456 domain-containing protein [Chthonobacter rhizosphaerae]